MLCTRSDTPVLDNTANPTVCPATMTMPKNPHRHALYEAAVQCVEADTDFILRTYKRLRGEKPLLLREDFCGTAALCCDWVKRSAKSRAWGVDIHRPTLEWGEKHNLAILGKAAQRITLLNCDVRAAGGPLMDVVAAFNFSYWIFKTREELRAYFETVRASLGTRGVFFLDAFGGTDAMVEGREKRKVKASTTAEGEKVPAFRYIWETARFNPIDHDVTCFIHFELKDGLKVERAFRYDWRFWTLPELRELLVEAGFSKVEVYVEGWDEQQEEGDGVYRRRTYFENQAGWVTYLVAF